MGVGSRWHMRTRIWASVVVAAFVLALLVLATRQIERPTIQTPAIAAPEPVRAPAASPAITMEMARAARPRSRSAVTQLATGVFDPQELAAGLFHPQAGPFSTESVRSGRGEPIPPRRQRPAFDLLDRCGHRLVRQHPAIHH